VKRSGGSTESPDQLVSRPCADINRWTDILPKPGRRTGTSNGRRKLRMMEVLEIICCILAVITITILLGVLVTLILDDKPELMKAKRRNANETTRSDS
jgi:hypothetical protein